MTLEACLASLHLLAILSLVVFLSSEAALCRAEWLNAAVLRRLATLDVIYGLAAVAVLLTGVARVVWGTKGLEWYVSQPLFHAKILLFFGAALLSLRPTVVIRRWRKDCEATGALPSAQAVQRLRRWILLQAHLIPIVAVMAVFWARGM